MNRREFLVRVGGTLVAVPVLLQVVSCGTNNPAAPAHVDQFSAAATGQSHTHNATLTCSQLASGTVPPITSTSAGHVHQVQLTDTDLVTIASGGVATVVTNDQGHTHQWAFQKPSNAC